MRLRVKLAWKAVTTNDKKDSSIQVDKIARVTELYTRWNYQNIIEKLLEQDVLIISQLLE